MEYEKLVNINSDNPNPEWLKEFIIECEQSIKLYRSSEFKNFGKEMKNHRWLKIARQQLADIDLVI